MFFRIDLFIQEVSVGYSDVLPFLPTCILNNICIHVHVHRCAFNNMWPELELLTKAGAGYTKYPVPSFGNLACHIV